VILEDNLDFCKEILFKHLNEITADGRLPNLYPNAVLGSSDGIGWLFKRISDFMDYCEEKDVFNQYFTLYDIKYVRERLRFSLKQIIKNYSRDGLIINNSLETWMDTFYKDNSFETDFREGFRIEIQALFLNMIRLMNKLNGMLANKFIKKSSKLVNVTTDEDYASLERKTVEAVRNCFLSRKLVNGKDRLVLNDGYNSSFADVSRPNIFLAYYIYKDLLYDSEWETVFDYVIERLWCDWTTNDGTSGGFSTIDKENSLYQPNHTGQNNKSYHRGDSWFWINNIAAISLSRLNSTKYNNYIHSILNSSSEDILFSGYLGYASELSSSSDFKSAGCYAQTWSIATYIELFHELYMKY
jgi:glycogen debranching enzyme